MPFVRQQESRTPVDKCVRRHLEEELKPREGQSFRCHSHLDEDSAFLAFNAEGSTD
jgi:hypothetical protein